MQTTEMLQKQHQKILDIIDAMYPLLNADIISKDTFEISNLLATLSGKLRSHITIEGSLLYPSLINSEDLDVSGKARKFIDETDGFSEDFIRYVHKWQNSLLIQEKSGEFINETNSMLSLISGRIQREDNEIFPIFNRINNVKQSSEDMTGEKISASADRRIHPRYQVQYIAYTFWGDEQLGSTVIDVSECGAGVMLPKKIALGEVLTLRVRCGPSFDKINEIECKAKIVWVEEEAVDEMYRTGLQITDISSEDFAKLRKNIHELAGKQDKIAGIDISEKTVLLIEDTEAISYIMKFDLEKSGFKMLTAINGEIGIKIAQSDQPDIILLDIMLPGINGFETCRRLKSDERTKEIPVVFLSVKSQHEDILKGLDAGAAAYIVKSSGFDKIYNKIVELIGSPK